MLLAMPYLADVNPIGPPSIVAMVICGVLALLSSERWELPGWPRQIFIGIALVVLVLMGPGFPAPRHGDADGVAAMIVCLAFGFGFSLACLRSRSVVGRVIGAAFSYLYGGLLAFKSADVLVAHDKARVVVVIFWILWTPAMIWWGRRPKGMKATPRSGLWARPAR